MRFAQIIMEGGNVFKNELATVDIKQADVAPTVSFLADIIGHDPTGDLLGSTGKKAVSGDLDIGIDQNEITKDELAAKLSAWVKAHGGDPKDYVKKSGVSVHFRTPIRGDTELGFVQTDFMFLPDIVLSRFSMVADPNSKYKDSHKHIVLSSVAKAHGFKWSPTVGLISRTTDKLFSKDPDEIAKTLLGPSATRRDITSVEAILNKLKGNPDAGAALADARETLGKQGINI